MCWRSVSMISGGTMRCGAMLLGDTCGVLMNGLARAVGAGPGEMRIVVAERNECSDSGPWDGTRTVVAARNERSESVPREGAGPAPAVLGDRHDDQLPFEEGW